jgi:hypothetical protein
MQSNVKAVDDERSEAILNSFRDREAIRRERLRWSEEREDELDEAEVGEDGEI